MTMQPDPEQRPVTEFFTRNLHHGDWRALGWASREAQERRFEVLAEIGSLSGTRVLDVGCGLGDLYGHLRARQIQVSYTGYDLLPEMVERASRSYPEARFVVRDVLQGLGTERFDYIVSSGAFNIDFGGFGCNVKAVQRLLREMYAACTRGVAINFLSSARDPIFYRYDPDALKAFCQTFCPCVQLRQDYLPNDFTLYLRKP